MVRGFGVQEGALGYRGLGLREGIGDFGRGAGGGRFDLCKVTQMRAHLGAGLFVKQHPTVGHTGEGFEF